MLKLRSKLLLALLPITFLYARLAGGALPYFLFYFFLLISATACLWTVRMRRNLSVIYEADQRVVRRGDSLAVTVRIENEGFLPIPWIRLADYTFATASTDSAKLAALHLLPGLRTRLMHYDLEARRRGCYPLGPLQANLGDIFGVFELELQFEGRRELLVYPNFTPLSYLPLPLRQPFGQVRTRRKAYEDPTELAELRPMKPGDSPKRIHWKTSARMGEFYVKEYELKATAELFMVVDLNENAHVWDGTASTLEKAIETAAAVGHYCLTSGYRTRLLGRSYQQWDVDLRPGPQGYRQLMEVLARAEETPGPELVEVLSPQSTSLPPRATLLVFTADPDPKLLEALLGLKNRGYGAVFFFIDPGQYLSEADRPELQRHAEHLRRLNEESIPTFTIRRDQELAELVEAVYGQPARRPTPQARGRGF